MSESSNLKFENDKEFLMYYHTILRNIGLYTSVALAGIAAARGLFATKGHKLSAFVTTILSGSFILISIQMSRLLSADIVMATKQLDSKTLDSWSLLPKVTLYLNIVLLMVAIGVLFDKLSQ